MPLLILVGVAAYIGSYLLRAHVFNGVPPKPAAPPPITPVQPTVIIPPTTTVGPNGDDRPVV